MRVYRLSIPQKDVHMRFQMFEILDDKMIVQYKRDSVFDEVMEDEETSTQIREQLDKVNDWKNK